MVRPGIRMVSDADSRMHVFHRALHLVIIGSGTASTLAALLSTSKHGVYKSSLHPFLSSNVFRHFTRIRFKKRLQLTVLHGMGETKDV